MSLSLLIDWDDIKARAAGISAKLDRIFPTSAEQQAVLDFIQDFLELDADTATPGDSQYELRTLRLLQIALGAWYAAFITDNPAGTGSLSGVSINSFSVSNTMAKNNSEAKDLLNANQYGTEAFMYMSWRPTVHIMI